MRLTRLALFASTLLAVSALMLVSPRRQAPTQAASPTRLLDWLAVPSVHARVGGTLPPFTLPAATGGPTSGTFRLGPLIGQAPVVVLFWATWCGPCQQELPFYETLYQRHRAAGLRVVAISMDAASTISRVGPAARRLGVTFDVVTDLDTRVTTQINPRRSAPFSIWINRQGRITWEREGYAPAEQRTIAEGIAALVAR